MNKLIFSSIVLLQTFIFTNCNQDLDFTRVDSNPDKNILSRTAYDFDGKCDDEYWNGSMTSDCQAPPKNCAVICGVRANDSNYSSFVSAVQGGTIVNFYTNGPGQSFLTLTAAAYSDLVSQTRTFIKVPVASNPDKYALY
ncbi:MAG: hypothetical protein V9E90_05255 [Saprospiraceae bacterium]|jgi:hypothetical protein